MSKIQYKPLEKTLNMCLEIETYEKTALNDKYSLKVFDVNILPAKVSFWSGHQNIEVLRKPVEINHIPNNEADVFVQQISTVLNHLTIKLDFNGVPVSIGKQDELWQNWLILRTNLASGYTGDWIEKTLTEIDKKLLPGERLLPYIMQDIFLNEYFRDAYNALFIENCLYGKRLVYGLCPSPILFNEKLILQTSPSSQLINLSGEGDEICNQSGFSSWLKNKSDYALPQIKAEGFYQIDNVTGWCNSLESNYKLSTNDYEKTLKIVLNTH